jgi:hypothetical protein
MKTNNTIDMKCQKNAPSRLISRPVGHVIVHVTDQLCVDVHTWLGTMCTRNKIRVSPYKVNASEYCLEIPLVAINWCLSRPQVIRR